MLHVVLSSLHAQVQNYLQSLLREELQIWYLYQHDVIVRETFCSTVRIQIKLE